MNLVFQIVGKCHLWSQYSRMSAGVQDKNCPAFYYSFHGPMALKNLLIIGLLITSRNVGFFSLRLAELVQLPCFPGRSACYFNKLHDFSVSVCMSHSFITIRFIPESLILTNDNRLIFDEHDKNHCDF